MLWALFEQHAAALLAFALRITDGDRGRAEDIVQETLLRAWRQPNALGESRPARAWLFTVARNVAVDAFRARRSRPAEVVGDDALAVVPAGDEIAPQRQLLLNAWLRVVGKTRDLTVYPLSMPAVIGCVGGGVTGVHRGLLWAQQSIKHPGDSAYAG